MLVLCPDAHSTRATASRSPGCNPDLMPDLNITTTTSHSSTVPDAWWKCWFPATSARRHHAVRCCPAAHRPLAGLLPWTWWGGYPAPAHSQTRRSRMVPNDNLMSPKLSSLTVSPWPSREAKWLRSSWKEQWTPEGLSKGASVREGNVY